MALREVLARFGFEVDTAPLRRAQAGVGGAVDALKKMGAILAGAAIVRGVSNFVSGQIQLADELAGTAKVMDLSTDELQRWRLAAEYANVDASELNVGMRTLAKQAYDAGQAGGEAGRLFKELGVDVKNANGQTKGTSELMRDTGIALSRMTSATDRAAIAQKLFGRSGAKLGPLFEGGAEGLDKLLKKLDEFGGGMTPEFVEQAERADDALIGFKVASQSLKSQLMVALLPGLAGAIEKFSKFAGWLAQATKGTNAFKMGLLLVASVITRLGIAKYGAQFLKLAATVAKPLAIFALLILLLDDLIVLFKGGKSVIGAFLDKLFGKGSASAVVGAIKGIVSALVKGDFKGALKKGADALDALGKAIVDFWSGDSEGPIAEFFASFGAAIIRGMVVAYNAIADGLGDIGSTIYKFFADAWESAVQWVADLIATVVNGASDLYEAGADLAKSIVDGFKNAILDQVSDPGDTVAAWTRKAIAGARSPKGIDAHSPSKKGAKLAEDFKAGWDLPFKRGGFASMLDAFKAPRSATAVSTTTTVRPAMVVNNPVFRSDIKLTIGSGASVESVKQARAGLTGELASNREATLAALVQLAPEAA